MIILSAGMGAGHDRVSAELARRLESQGFAVDVVDMWALLPPVVGRAITAFYKAAILRAPWLYSLIYRVWFAPRGSSGATVSPLVALAGRRLAASFGRRQPDLVVSTFHMCSQVGGWLRRTGQLSAPAVSIVVDFAAHRLWVDPGIDAHICLHDVQADRVARRGGRGVVTTGPIVRPEFSDNPAVRAAARHRLGVADGERVVLVVAGSWGAGDIEGTVRTVAGRGGYRTIVVAGHNRPLEERLRRIPGATVFGWVPDMENVVAAADVVVENAGGLSAMEAIAAGVPVISYSPIPGHGRENGEAMAEAGISALATSEEELASWLQQLTEDSPARRRMRAAGRAMWRADAGEVLASLAGTARPTPAGAELGVQPSYRRRRWQMMVTRN